MNAQINVCKECPNRYRIITEDMISDCHDHCERYREAKVKHQEMKDAKSKIKAVEADYWKSVASQKEKIRKKHNGHYRSR